jgi:L-fuconate dehydratase
VAPQPSFTITGVRTMDVRFPTSDHLDGSDAMHPDPDYSAAYALLDTDLGLVGHGFTFTIGRGNELCCAAIDALAHAVIGARVSSFDDIATVAHRITNDTQLRWLGPDKGVIHLAAAALINAIWDAVARQLEQPLWAVLSSMTPQQLVRQVDFRHLTDHLTPDRALAILNQAEPTRSERRERLEREGLAAYTTSAGWLGYSDDLVRSRALAARDAGFGLLKLKVGADISDDIRRVSMVRDAVGPDVALAVDANQRWEVADAITAISALAPFGLSWAEEPTSPDDILGHKAIADAVHPVRVATGEHCQNRVMFKQFLAAGAMQVCQLDACRVGGVNENIAICLLAAHFGVPVIPHAGGVGLCEVVQHLAMFDVLAVGGSFDGRMVEFADHLHEHFVTPVRIVNGRYQAPTTPGSSAELLASSAAEFAFPTGPVWSARRR